MFIGEVNYVGVLIVAIIHMAIGWYWYSPAGFGKQWMAALGFGKKEEAAMKKTAGQSMMWGLVMAFISAFVLSHIIRLAGATTAGAGASVGFWIWLGFFATTQIGIVLWENKPFKLYKINTGYYLVSLLIGGAILAAWY